MVAVSGILMIFTQGVVFKHILGSPQVKVADSGLLLLQA